MSAARSALADRLGAGLGGGFWALLSASFLANLSDGIFLIALPLLAVGLTDEPALVAGVAVASRLPWLVFALIAGALADRFDRRRTMVFVDGARALILAGLTLAVATGTASIWLLYLVAFVLGCLETMFDTAASSMLPTVVGADRVVTANSRLFAVETAMNQFVGPPVGGFLAAIAISAAFGTAAAGYLGALLCLLALRGSFRPQRDGPPTSMASEIRAGLSYLAQNRLLRTMALIVAPMNLGSTAIWGVFVLYAVAPGPLGLDEIGFGLLTTSLAVGTVLGMLIASRLDGWLGRPNLFVACILALLVQDLVFIVIPNAIAVGVALALTGAVTGSFNVIFGSLRQRIVPNHLLGRVMASFRIISWGSLPLGALLGGLVGQRFGLTAVFITAAVIHGLLLFSRLILNDRFMAEVEEQARANVAAQTQAQA
jgi:MFS family permease